MTAAPGHRHYYGGRLLALFVACYVALAACVLALCAASKRPEASALIDLRDGAHRVAGGLPCPSTGGSHIVVATPSRGGSLWNNRCEKCGEEWQTRRTG